MEQIQKMKNLGAFLPEVDSTESVEYEKPEARSKSESNLEELPYDKRYSKIEPGSSTTLDESKSSWYQLAIPSNNGNIGGDDLNSLLYNDDGVFGGLFSTRKPRDAMAGFSSGMKTVGKGVAAGVASLVAAPVVGAATEGVSGFFKGVGAGLVAAVALPVTAVGVAGYQMARGVANTPEAISESNKGRKWDKKNRQWIEYYYSLEEEIKQLEERENSQVNQEHVCNEQDNSDKSRAPNNISKNVVDTTYYDLLSVSPGASPDEIRRQYYRKAKQYHPDKNPDDNEAKEKFQKLGEAYQILADPELRRRYDEYGMGATEDMPVIDSSLIFTLLFGSDNLEKYVGKLKMASLVEIASLNGNSNMNNSNTIENMIENEQNKRTVRLAQKMRDKILPILNEFDADNSVPTENSEKLQKWREEISQEARELCSNSFCDSMVEAIGWSYENYGSQYLGKIDTFLGIGGRYAKFQAKTRNVATTWKMASTAIKTAMAAQNLQSAIKKDHMSEDEKGENKDREDSSDAASTQQKFEETLPLILETMLQMTLMDIEDTVRTVAKKLVKDMGVDSKVRKQRALAIIEFGSTFQKVANACNLQREENGEKPDARRKVEEAFIKAAQQRDEK
ncbi:DNAJ protein [Cryptosporidium ryanae]|uniref:DNAJ protein n=1 Tax=Cryptosporidium ryanae TaxID=515981 RepID=UPI00351A87F8|nr:DNAJ protein [Cryptosporidium ryanae]